MAIRIKFYDDHRADASCGPGVYLTVYLCDECAEELGDKVTYVRTPQAGDALYCQGCVRPNQAAEMKQRFWTESY